MRRHGIGYLLASILALGWLTGCHRDSAPPTDFEELSPGVGYANPRLDEGPWSIHVVRVDRTRPTLELHSVHAGGGALGLSPLSEQLRRIPATSGTPVAAINGDFYQRDRPHAGDPRGLQIVSGELISAPNGGVAFWIDSKGQPHTGAVQSRLQLVWPDGSTTPLGLNQEREPSSAVLYTPAAGPNTHTPDGLEIIVEPQGDSAGRPLRPGTTNVVRVRSTQTQGDSRIDPGTWVLSLGSGPAQSHSPPAPGTELSVITGSNPDLRGARTAIGGGPILVDQGRPQRIQAPSKDSYEFSSMVEQHPRSAVGWNDQFFFLVLVDGRQPDLSVGMTLEELAKTLAGLGCAEAMNLDGGGSATLWAEGKIRNSPCDGRERPIANALVVVRAPPTP